MKKVLIIILIYVGTLLTGCSMVDNKALWSYSTSVQNGAMFGYHNFLKSHELNINEIKDFTISKDYQSLKFKVKNIIFSTENTESTYIIEAELIGEENTNLFLSLIDNLFTEPSIPLDKNFLIIKDSLEKLDDNDGENLSLDNNSFEVLVTKTNGITSVRAELNTN